jgi:hypothetical protein
MARLSIADVVRMIDVPAARPDFTLRVEMDEEAQRAHGYLESETQVKAQAMNGMRRRTAPSLEEGAVPEVTLTFPAELAGPWPAL